MAKNKKPRILNHNHDDGPKQRGNGVSGKAGKENMAYFPKLNTSISKSKGSKASRKQQQKQQQRQKQKQQNATIIPFEPRDRILLVGEG